MSLRPHVAVANFSLVQPKSAGGETLFSAKLSTIESPLSGLLTGMLHFCFCPQHMPFVLDRLFESGCIGSKIAIAIQEATIYMRLDSSGVPHWVNLLKVGAIQASKVLLSGTLLSSKLHPPFPGSGRSEGCQSSCTSSHPATTRR